MYLFFYFHFFFICLKIVLLLLLLLLFLIDKVVVQQKWNVFWIVRQTQTRKMKCLEYYGNTQKTKNSYLRGELFLTSSMCSILKFTFKGAQSYFSRFSFLFHLKNHLSKDVNFKFQLKQSSRLDVQTILYIYCSCPYLYCVSLIMVTITRHFILSSTQNIFHLNCHGLWEKYELSCDSKISKSLKKVEEIRLGSFKH